MKRYGDDEEPECSKKVKGLSPAHIDGLFASLPQEMLIKIFQHLSFSERCKVARFDYNFLKKAFKLQKGLENFTFN